MTPSNTVGQAPPSGRTHSLGWEYWADRTRACRVAALALFDSPGLFDRLPTTTWYAAMSQQLLQAMSPTATDRLLDLGCGSGRHAIGAAHLVSHVVAADRSSKMLDMARKNRDRSGVRNLDLRLEDGEALSFSEDAFDLATGYMLLPAVQDPARVLRELVRVVCPGGRIGLLVPSESLTPANAWTFAKRHGLSGFDKASLIAWAQTSRRFATTDLQRLLGPGLEHQFQVVPLLEGMAFAAIVTKPWGCTAT